MILNDNKIPHCKTRTERNIKWIALQKELRDLGYWAQPMFLNQWMRYRVMVVIINHLAHVLKREPLRVYQAALCRAERTARGKVYTAFKQARPPEDGLSDADRAHGFSVLCPKCGQELLDCGRETKAEVLRSIKMKKQIPRKSPQS